LFVVVFTFRSFYYFFCVSSLHFRPLHSFPTRRSSDLLMPIMTLGFLAAGLSRAGVSAQRVFELLDTEVEVADKPGATPLAQIQGDRKSTRLNSSHLGISYAVFCLKKKKKEHYSTLDPT